MRGEKCLLSLIIGLGCCAAARAVVNDADHPYRPITVRNVFSLKAPPEKTPEPLLPPPPSTIKLSGITDINGRKQVLFVINESPRPGQPLSLPQFLIMIEGETQGQITINEIDQRGGSVKLVNAGVPQSLNFEKDGVQPPSGPAPSAYSSLKEIPSRPVPTPTVLPHNMTADEQKIIMEAQRQLRLESGRGTEANLIPPTNLRPPPQPQ